MEIIEASLGVEGWCVGAVRWTFLLNLHVSLPLLRRSRPLCGFAFRTHPITGVRIRSPGCPNHHLLITTPASFTKHLAEQSAFHQRRSPPDLAQSPPIPLTSLSTTVLQRQKLQTTSAASLMASSHRQTTGTWESAIHSHLARPQTNTRDPHHVHERQRRHSS
jgi:hypothetical protein